MSLRWFKGPDGDPFQVQCRLGIHVPRLADELHLKASPLKLSGVVVEFDSSTGYMVDTAFLADLGATRESAIQVTGQPAAAAGVCQTGSLETGEIFVDVIMENDGKQLQAGLLVDTGCNLALNISDYKADQLGLPQNGDRARLEMGQGNLGEVQRRGTALTAVLLQGEGAEVIKDPHRSRYLEVWTDVGTRDSCGGSAGNGSSSSSAPSRGRSSGDDSSAAPVLTIQVLSPICKGVDSRGHDAILGAPGMAALGLGIDRDTMRLYRKQGSSTFRKLSRKVATTPPAAEQQ